MRTRIIVVLGVLLAATSAGCSRPTGDGGGVATAASGKPKASASTAVSGSGPDADLEFSRCMREQGLDWFPDPQADGRMELSLPQGVDPATVDKAQQACKRFLPNGGEPPKLSAEEIEQNRALSRCMRENGVPNFPDPQPDGQLGIDGNKLGTGPGNPAFDAAVKACAQYRPDGGGERSEHVEKKA
ncbi:hypothetical protein Ait01nite_022380 [Actinoplanes italicus]|uniref:Subtilisin inhibitor-like n=1 Tax=Actinoplanes italicus TaxID=113567 RepID=A0A2T0KNQ4_9ACTN|nr:hypothetical protein [Actinoplanes italicus]PRX25367.1 hypothetical protein CLV67_10180 [Actinoplanes italicus]GIE29193.1 hypothetical protein Ait01nite_022380 [Actinoplanes italicus]